MLICFMTLFRKTMHESVKSYVAKIKERFPERFKNTTVLEVGSQDINGSVREFFENCDYVGIDLFPGKWVDIVVNVNDYAPCSKFDVVISTEALEHDKDWKESLYKMRWLTKRFWLLIVTCANINRKEHWTARTSPENSPWTLDYYGNISKEDVLKVLPSAHVEESADQKDLYFYLLKE